MDFEKNVWLTVNRQCNLRCSWCYARNTAFSNEKDISLEKAFNIIDMVKSLNIKHISLIGGEPTLYNHLSEIIKYSKNKNIKCGIVTNGIRLANYEYLCELKRVGLDGVGMSLKGYSSESFKGLTGVDLYDTSLQAIENLSNIDIPFTVSMVIDKNNYLFFLKGIRDAKIAGASSFYLSFEFDFDLSNDNFDFISLFKMIDAFAEKYDKLCEITNDNFVLHQTLPLCIWDDNLIDRMNKKNQLFTSCQLLQKSGIVFDTNGNIIPCNALYDYILGENLIDFFDADSLKDFMQSEYITDFYKKIATIPSEKCLHCAKWSICGGGCVSNWLHYDLEMLMTKFNEYRAL